MAFIELIPPGRAQLEECVIELESSGGNQMRIQRKTTAPPDWTNLLRAWRVTLTTASPLSGTPALVAGATIWGLIKWHATCVELKHVSQ